jgi:hypothetical protein
VAGEQCRGGGAEGRFEASAARSDQKGEEISRRRSGETVQSAEAADKHANPKTPSTTRG